MGRAALSLCNQGPFRCPFCRGISLSHTAGRERSPLLNPSVFITFYPVSLSVHLFLLLPNYEPTNHQVLCLSSSLVNGHFTIWIPAQLHPKNRISVPMKLQSYLTPFFIVPSWFAISFIFEKLFDCQFPFQKCDFHEGGTLDIFACYEPPVASTVLRL